MAIASPNDRLIRVDMTRSEARVEPFPEAWRTLGGRALTARALLDEWEFNRRAGLDASDDDLPACMKEDAIGANGDLVFPAETAAIPAVYERQVTAADLCKGTATG